MRDVFEWVPRLQAGEDEAWQEFVRVYGRFVPIVSGPLGLGAAEQEEVLQEMTLTAYRSIRNLRDPARLASWTYTIARRAAIVQWKAGRMERTGADDQDSPDISQIASGETPVDELLIAWEDAGRLRDAVAALKPPCRRLVTDLFLREPRLSYKEVSESYGMAMGSIGPTLARCLGSLRQAWKPRTW